MSVEGAGPAGGPRKIGKYVIKRELGRGGMGAVYLAEQPGLGREVAIKELIVSTVADPTALARFMQEAQVMARSSHPNLVQVHDLEQEGEANYIVLEYVKGQSLRDWLTAGRVPLPKVFAVMHGLLQALDYAHKHAIVHRDVKPENLLLSLDGDVKVTDFGIARLTDDSGGGTATKTGTTVGTPQYMSPEQVASSKVDGRSDLYSAGIILYELVCGRPPFVATEADGPFTLMAKHVQAPPPPPTLLSPGLDPELEEVILKSLAKRPEDRYQTGADFDAALSKVAGRLAPGWLRSLDPSAVLDTMTPAAAPIAATLAGLGTLPTAAVTAVPPSPTSPAAPAPPVVATASRVPTAASAPSPTAAPLYAPPPPLPSARRASKGPSPVLLGGGGLALLVVIGVILVVTLGGQKPPVPSPSPATSVVPAGNCDWLKPGVELGAGKGSGSCAVLGASVLSVPFAGASSLPSDLRVEANDANGNPISQPPAVAVGGGYAQVASPTRGY
ncbi:MAG TPA: serine/threonine-protein kinase, partial [Candidatus Acidoferrales bacterium]|nr:serine/threonine-protein kinase [Candidatus Acidoferrales bacterium]